MLACARFPGEDPVICHLNPVRRALPALLALGLAYSGCSGNKVVPAVGPAYEIIVLAPKGMKVLAEAVEAVLGEEIVTVRHEPRFQITKDVMEDYRFYRTRKILLAVGPRRHEAVRKLQSKATGMMWETALPGFEIEWEPFSDGQVLFWITGSPQKIIRMLDEHRNEIISIVEETTIQLIRRTIYRIGEKESARRQMRQRWDWGVRLPFDWVVEERSSDENRFVRIWRDGPVVQLFVSWEEGEVTRTTDEWLERRHELVWHHYDRDKVVFDHSRSHEGRTPFGRAGTILKGLWENDVYTIGGPFESWAFYCRDDDRTYLLDISVYAPDREKLPLLRVGRAVVSTFHCACVGRVHEAPESTP